MKIDQLLISSLRRHYASGDLTPEAVIESLYSQILAGPLNPVWTYLLPKPVIQRQLDALKNKSHEDLPLFGIPFAIKDNIDIEGHPTSAGCPDYAYEATHTAPVVTALLQSGAILIGKTALDQFATGTTGTRSAYGPCPSALNADYVAGGSSSGSAVAVASGLVSFSLGTDTAGSGRIPAAFNGIVGLKPTRGRVSIRGIVPACRSIDCVAIFSQTVQDAEEVLRVIEGYDHAEAYSRPLCAPPRQISNQLEDAVIAIPRQADLEFFDCVESEAAFDTCVADLRRRAKNIVEVDYRPFDEAAKMIYSGPWMAERLTSVGSFVETHPASVHPVTLKVLTAATKFTAADLFAAEHRLAELKRITSAVFDKVDVLVTPTVPRTYRISEVLSDPFKLNNNLSYYTNFVNLLDLCAVAVPASHHGELKSFGLSFVAPAWQDLAISSLAKDYAAGAETQRPHLN